MDLYKKLLAGRDFQWTSMKKLLAGLDSWWTSIKNPGSFFIEVHFWVAGETHDPQLYLTCIRKTPVANNRNPPHFYLWGGWDSPFPFDPRSKDFPFLLKIG